MPDTRPGLAGTSSLLALTAAVLFAVALTTDVRPNLPGSADAPPTTIAEPNPQRALALAARRTPRVAERVERLRGLEFGRVPAPRLATLEQVRRRAQRVLRRPRTSRRVALAEAELRLLGLLEPDRALAGVAADVSGLALAYYEPRRDRLVVVGDAAPPGPVLGEMVLAHELNHALEDQHFGLPSRTGLADDRALAQDALVEGTATALMLDYAGRHLDPLALAVEASAVEGGESGDLPRFAEAEIDFTYLEGAEFVERLLSFGRGWGLPDYALSLRPPRTTEQILHPDKYLADERPKPVASPATPGRRWRPLDAGTLGEFGTREVLRAAAGAARVEQGAAGWGGDRYRLFARPGAGPRCEGTCRRTHALGIAWQGDDASEARELQRELRSYVAAGLAGTRTARAVWHLGEGWAALGRRGARVGLGLGPSATVARRVASPG